jgi:hypothetical protein
MGMGIEFRKSGTTRIPQNIHVSAVYHKEVQMSKLNRSRHGYLLKRF